jgi:phage/plasmid-like protein (TIGR03299 family)
MHNIDMSVPNGAFAAVREPGWHQLGVVTQEQVDALTLLQMGHGDYEVFLAPCKTTVEVPIAPGSPITVLQHAEDPRVRNVCRMHPVTGQVQIIGQSSPDKAMWNNRDVFVGWADNFMQMAKPTVSACGVLDDGRRAFMAWRLPQNILVHGNRDLVELWMTAVTSYDGSLATLGYVSAIRAVCQNTVTAGLAAAISKYRVKRTKNAKLNVEQAKEMLGLTYKYAEEYRQIADRMADHTLSVQSFDSIIANLWGPEEDETNKRTLNTWEKKRDTLVHLFTEAESNADIHRTAWGAYQAVAEYVDHMTEVKAASAKGAEDGYRLWRGMTGEKNVATPKGDIFDVLSDLVGV